MGSSPFTATTPTTRHLVGQFEAFMGTLDVPAPDGANLPNPPKILVAFSGGPDSTALLWASKVWARSHRAPHTPSILAAHLDHALDPGSAERAEQAAHLANTLGVELVTERVEGTAPPGESLEAYARRCRYDFLERVADLHGCTWIATAHHADDQAETVLLRLLYGSGLAGLAGIRPRWGRRIRPWLGVRRREILAALDHLPLRPIEDPTNQHLERPRNRLRKVLIPRLADQHPSGDLIQTLLGLANAASGAHRRILELLTPRLDPRPLGPMSLPVGRGASVARDALATLPEPLFPSALALLHQHAGAPYPPSAKVRQELRRQLDQGKKHPVGCDSGHGWRFEGDSQRVISRSDEPSPGDFAYTLVLPGAVDIPEAGLRFRLQPATMAPWMFRGAPERAGLAGPLLITGQTVVIRNRRPGDRLQPLGHQRTRRLKELLIDHRIPRWRRDRLPLLVVDGLIAWVPGVTIGNAFALPQVYKVDDAGVADDGSGSKDTSGSNDKNGPPNGDTSIWAATLELL